MTYIWSKNVEVSLFLSRDLDSRLSAREAAAVNQFLRSDRMVGRINRSEHWKKGKFSNYFSSLCLCSIVTISNRVANNLESNDGIVIGIYKWLNQRQFNSSTRVNSPLGLVYTKNLHSQSISFPSKEMSLVCY